MINISTIIVAKNNPAHIFDTIDSIINISNEIIILDIGMSANLINKINKQKNINLIKIKQEIKYVELIREESKKFAKNDWVLFLDPDEVITKEIADIIKNKIDDYDCVAFPRKNIIFNKWIEHSRWWPDHQIRLFKKDSVVWPTIIHQQPEVSGKLLTLVAKEEQSIIHYNYDSIDQYFEKMIRYARIEAETLAKYNPNYSLTDTIKNAISEFISRYFANNGYKDGMHGFTLSILQMFNSFLVYFYFWEIKKYQNIDSKIINNNIQTFFTKALIETNHWLISKKLVNKVEIIKIRLVNLLLRNPITSQK